MTRLDVITGFLGAGKTTFLARYISWMERRGESCRVIENEFGRAGVDGAILKRSGVQVDEISGGCVCCTLKVTLHDLLRELSGKVDRVLLEPSGLFCGDDLLDILQSPDAQIVPGMWIGVVDPMAIPEMNAEDRAVLQSELMQAGSVLISKARLASAEELCAAREWVYHALPAPVPAVYSRDWSEMRDDEWFPALRENGMLPRAHERRRFDHQSMFQSATLAPKRCFDAAELKARVEALMRGGAGSVLRVKGCVCAETGMLRINAAPGSVTITHEAAQEHPALNIIGRGLRREALRAILEAEK